MHSLRRLARAVSAGALAGLATLAFDELLILLCLGAPIPLAGRFVVAYLALGAALALAVESTLLLRGRPALGFWKTSALTAALIYALAIFERVYNALDYRWGSVQAIVGAGLAIALFALWTRVLERLVATRDPALSWLLGACTAAIGLAVNRNLVNRPLEAKALIADAAVLTGILLLALIARFAGPRQTLAAIATLVTAVTCFATLSWWTMSPTTDRSSIAHPNLVLLVIDTLRQDVFKAVVEETEEGRAFHEALEGAAWFTQALSTSPWTVPSVGSLMTGLYPSEHGFDAAPSNDPSRPLKPLPDSIPTLASELRQRGYRTEAIVTNPLLQPISGIARGFETFEVLFGPTVKLPPLTALAKLGLLDKVFYQQADSVRRRLAQRLDEISATARPVFLWLHLLDPHAPLFEHPRLTPDPAAADLPALDRRYRNEVRFTLAELTRVIGMLRDHDLWDNSVVVLTSDHGEMLPSDRHVNRVTPGLQRQIRYGHGHALYDELVRVPLVIRPAHGLPAPRRVDVLNQHTDLWDTVADLLNLDLPRIGRDRVSLAPWVASDAPTTEPRQRKNALLSGMHYGPAQRALRTPVLKLIEYPQGEHPSELYDLAKDPDEQRDIAARGRLLAMAQRRLVRFGSRLREPPETEARELDAETIERLKALGYL